jgi:hypothetical protein
MAAKNLQPFFFQISAPLFIIIKTEYLKRMEWINKFDLENHVINLIKVHKLYCLLKLILY